MKINDISPDQHDYTKILNHIAKPPIMLHYLGVLPAARVPSVAIVGTRKPTSYGKEVTTRIASELAQKRIVIISGLALGVDGIAHKAALNADGTTVAVLGNGLPSIYPRTHKSLADAIVEKGGAILSEYSHNEQARPHYFLERNRIVSGLADAVIITEAAQRSGTLNTAMHALEQGKEVFAVPGPITSPMSSGCNQLIKQGATPLLSGNDVLESIAPDLLQQQATLALGSNRLETAIIELLRSGVRDGDELQQRTNVPAHELSATLTMLEINGMIRNLGANQWTIR